jgi:hypothetical protein
MIHVLNPEQNVPTWIAQASKDFWNCLVVRLSSYWAQLMTLQGNKSLLKRGQHCVSAAYVPREQKGPLRKTATHLSEFTELFSRENISMVEKHFLQREYFSVKTNWCFEFPKFDIHWPPEWDGIEWTDALFHTFSVCEFVSAVSCWSAHKEKVKTTFLVSVRAGVAQSV